MFTKRTISTAKITAMPSTGFPRQGARIGARSLLAVLLVCVVAGCSSKDSKKQAADTQGSTATTEKTVDYCALASKADLAKLDRKPLYTTATQSGCMWSEEPNGMAELSMSIHAPLGKLRIYFATDLPSNVKLVDVKDLGDSGLMSVVDGNVGVVVVKKGNRVLQSANMLDIKPGSEGQKTLWQIYGRALDQ